MANDFSSRRTGVVSLKDAISALLKTYNLKTKFNETYLVAFWEKMMGQTIASRTTQIYVKNKVLFLKIDSSPLRNELLMAKTKLIDLINKDVGEEVVNDVVFL
jgi:predicted nucleic acid-binding Zn ribbon protein